MRHLLCELEHPGILDRVVDYCPMISLTVLHKLFDCVFMGYRVLILCFRFESHDEREKDGD
jgi:hypothetical protein